MGKVKLVGLLVGGLIAIMALAFVLELFGLGMFKFFEPKREKVDK